MNHAVTSLVTQIGTGPATALDEESQTVYNPGTCTVDDTGLFETNGQPKLDFGGGAGAIVNVGVGANAIAQAALSYTLKAGMVGAPNYPDFPGPGPRVAQVTCTVRD
eukprot:gene19573-64771_t